MNILFELLNELNYRTQNQFTFDIIKNSVKTIVNVTPFISVDYSCQTYLVVEITNQDLIDVNDSCLKSLALAFRKAPFHESDMDKNTTLVIISSRSDTEMLNSEAKVRIEDDPYYFKKYVFSHTIASEQHAQGYLEHMKETHPGQFSFVSEILDYLMKAEYFEEYKNNKDDLSTYSYFVELVTKIPAFPINIKNSETVKSVSELLAEQLNGKEIDIKLLDYIALADVDYIDSSIETVLEKYYDLTNKISQEEQK